MPLRLFTLLAATSLVLCAAIVAIGLRSFYAGYTRRTITPVQPDDFSVVTTTAMEIGRGGVGFRHLTVSVGDPTVQGWLRQTAQQRNSGWTKMAQPAYPWLATSRPADFDRLGLQWATEAGLANLGGAYVAASSVHGGWLVLPLWLPATLFAVAPAVWSIRRWARHRDRKRRDLAGHCLACGYDLRASPARPECGAMPAERQFSM